MREQQISALARRIANLSVKDRVVLWRKLRELDDPENGGGLGVREPRNPTPPTDSTSVSLLPPRSEGPDEIVRRG